MFEEMNFYSHEKVGERVYVVTEGYCSEFRFTLGVVTGDEKVLVIDAGLGMAGGLRRYIEGVVGKDKPIICACTHGHVDHVGSAVEFDEAYLNERDYDVLPGFGLYAPTRFGDLSAFSCDNPEVLYYAVEHYVKNENTRFQNIDDGDVLDLGGVCVRAISVPGHSEGSLAYYIPDEKICFSGDAVNFQVHIKRKNEEELLECRRALLRFGDIVGEDCRLYSGHLLIAQPMSIVPNLAQAMLEVSEHKIHGDLPVEMIFKNQKNAKDRLNRAHYVGNSCLVYNGILIREG